MENKNSKLGAHIMLALRMLSVGSVLMSLMLFTMLFGPILESKFFPVVTDTVIEHVKSVDPEYTALQIFANKNRACELISLEGLSGPIGSPRQSEIRVLKADNVQGVEIRSRPDGQQDFGVWLFKPQGEYVKVVARHKCHPLWDTTSTFIEWKEKTVVTKDK